MRPMTKSTERRVPRMTGLPARTAESSTMRAGSAMVSPRARLAATVLSHLLEPPIVALPQPERSFACGHDVTKKMKGGFCVSTVSIVSGRAPRVDGCPRGLHLLDRAAVGSTDDRDRYRGPC